MTLTEMVQDILQTTLRAWQEQQGKLVRVMTLTEMVQDILQTTLRAWQPLSAYWLSSCPLKATTSPNYIACLAAVICILALFLPTEGDNVSNSHLLTEYPWLHFSVNQKLVFAYVLGLVTMAILRM